MVDRAGFDTNNRNTLIALSNAGDRAIVELWADPVTHELITSGSGGGGSGTSVIVDGVTNSIRGTVFDLTNSNPVATQIVDASGDAIVSFGGGVQYVDGASTPANPTGTMPVFDNNGAISRVSDTAPLPVSQIGAVTVQSINSVVFTDLATVNNVQTSVNIGTANNGTQRVVIASDQPALAVTGSFSPSGTQDVNITKVSGSTLSLGQQLAAASLPIVLTAAQLTTLTPPAAITGFATEATLATLNGKVTAVNTGAVIISSSALPTGAATAAKQDTGNTSLASIDGKITAVNTGAVVLAAGAAEIGNVKNSGTFAVQAAQSGTWNITNISGTISLPTGAATAAKQPALGTAGSASADVITVQGIASMTALKVDGSGVTQPVSGTVTANAGTNLNTSALALEATQVKMTIAQGTALGSNTVALVGGSVTTNAPTFTTGQINQLSLTTAGGLRVDLKDTASNTNNLNVNLAASAASVTVAQATAANLNATVVGNGTFVVQATLAAETTKVIGVVRNADGSGNLLTSTSSALDVNLKTSSITLNVSPNTATGSAVPANAFYNGGIAKTSLPSAATDGNLTGAMEDKYGRQVVLQGTIRDLVGTQTTTISASTTETTIVTAASSVFNDLSALVISNTSATPTRVDFRDTTAGTILFSLYIPAGDVRGIAFQRPVPQTTVNTNWTAQCGTSVTDLRVYAVFDKNR